MSTEKRLFLFLVLSLLILLSFQQLYVKEPAPKPEQETQPIDYQEVKDEPLPESVSGPLDLPESKLTTFETEDYVLQLATRGGFIKTIEIKKYEEVLPYQDLLVLPDYLDQDFRLERIPGGIRLVSGQEGQEVIKEVTFIDQYLCQVFIKAPRKIESLGIFSRQKEENRFYSRYQEIFYKDYKEGEITRLSWNKLKETQVLSSVSLAGARDSYYTSTLFDFPEGRIVLKKVNERFTLAWQPLSTSASFQAKLYLGPQDPEILKAYGLQDVRNFGFFHGIAMIIVNVLHFFFSIVKNWGLSIILFSILVYILFFPLTFRSSKAMKEMRQFQTMHKAELEKLKEKYKDQPQKIHQATMDLYKKYGFNPLKGCSSGCLPLFFQIPIIWAFWSVIPRALEFKGAGFLWIKDLSLPDRLLHLPVTLPFLGDWLNILPLLTAGIMYVQMKFSNPEIDPSQAQQQQIMSTIFPIMMAVFFYKLPSALLLYWFTNSVLTSISQWRIMKMKKA